MDLFDFLLIAIYVSGFVVTNIFALSIMKEKQKSKDVRFFDTFSHHNDPPWGAIPLFWPIIIPLGIFIWVSCVFLSWFSQSIDNSKIYQSWQMFLNKTVDKVKEKMDKLF